MREQDDRFVALAAWRYEQLIVMETKMKLLLNMTLDDPNTGLLYDNRHLDMPYNLEEIIRILLPTEYRFKVEELKARKKEQNEHEKDNDTCSDNSGDYGYIRIPRNNNS